MRQSSVPGSGICSAAKSVWSGAAAWMTKPSLSAATETAGRPSNGYAAKIRIRDRQGGAGDYAFSLYWTASRAGEPERLFARPGAWWSGRVDGTVRVWLTGTSGCSNVVAGRPVADERVRFDGPVPSGPAPNLAVRKIRGRGRVEIVVPLCSKQRPWRNRDY